MCVVLRLVWFRLHYTKLNQCCVQFGLGFRLVQGIVWFRVQFGAVQFLLPPPSTHVRTTYARTNASARERQRGRRQGERGKGRLFLFSKQQAYSLFCLASGPILFPCLGFRVQGLGFMVQGSGFRVQGLGFRVQGLGFGFRVQGLGFRVYGLGFRVQSARGRPRCFPVQQKRQAIPVSQIGNLIRFAGERLVDSILLERLSDPRFPNSCCM